MFFAYLTDRATVANMCPEYGATVGFFPVDKRTISYLEQTGRDAHSLRRIEKYLLAVRMFFDYENQATTPHYSTVRQTGTFWQHNHD